MAHDEALAQRVRGLMAGEPGLVERKMFGGLALMLDGNMACGVMGGELLVRIDPAIHEQVLAEPGTRPFAMNKRAAKGFVPVAAGADEQVGWWVERGIAYTRTLPPK